MSERAISQEQAGRSDRARGFVLLDGLRGLAAVAVMLYHYAGNLFNDWSRFGNAFHAVDFFFVLSGFIVAFAYEKRLLAGQKITSFLVTRLIRLGPLYWLLLCVPVLGTLYFPSWGFSAGSSPLSVLLAVFLLPAPLALCGGEGVLFPLNAAAWSLSLEIAFNLVYALLVARLTNLRLSAFLIAAAVALGAAFFQGDGTNLGWGHQNYWGGVARISWSFAAGLLLFRGYQKRGGVLPSWVGVFLGGFLLLLFAQPQDNVYFSFFCCLFVFPAVVWLGAQVSLPLKWAPLALWLGRISYALYIVHSAVRNLLETTFHAFGVDPYAMPVFSLVVWAAGAIGAAWALDAAFDTPVRSVLNVWRLKWHAYREASRSRRALA